MERQSNVHGSEDLILLRWHTPQIDLQIQSVERDSNPIENLAAFFTEIDSSAVLDLMVLEPIWF